ncbi:MAG: hypothetical protein V4548_08970 [Bacteroidota bacterium]
MIKIKKMTVKKQLTYLFIVLTTIVFGQTKQKENLSDFLPKGYEIFEKIYGDLNNDNVKDCILIIKNTDKAKIVLDEYKHTVDRNRRGIVILLNRKGKYEIVVRNYDCFSSENEDGGIYMPPDLSLEIKKGKLYVNYGYGRYGYWCYIFRIRNSDFELIGYDSSSNRGPIVNKEISINFLTKKKRVRENKNENEEQESGDEIFKEIWGNITVKKLLKLSSIKDFDELDMESY